MSMTVNQRDALQEVMNIGVGRAAQELNKLLQAHVSMQIPSVVQLSPQEIPSILPGLSSEPLTAVWLEFIGSYSGSAALLLPTESASRLVTALTHETPATPAFDAIRVSQLSDVGNVVISRMLEVIGDMLKQELTLLMPDVKDHVDNLLTLSGSHANSGIIFGKTHFSISALHIEGHILLMSPLGN